jgi:hypothetical protein
MSAQFITMKASVFFRKCFIEENKSLKNSKKVSPTISTSTSNSNTYNNTVCNINDTNVINTKDK